MGGTVNSLGFQVYLLLTPAVLAIARPWLYYCSNSNDDI